MSTFTPPADTPRSPIPPGTRGIQWRLFRHFTAPPAAANVFILTNNSVVTEWPAATYNTDGSINKFPEELISRVFYGAHGPYPVTAAEAALLTNAGYTVT